MTPEAAVLAMQSASRSLRQLAEIPSRIARRASRELQDVVEDQESREVDPYERPWKPITETTIRLKGGDTRILRETDHMLDSLEIKPMSGAGLSITFDPPYAAFHQIGTRDMPARPLLPTGPMPRAWSDALDRAANDELENWAKGARQ